MVNDLRMTICGLSANIDIVVKAAENFMSLYSAPQGKIWTVTGCLKELLDNALKHGAGRISVKLTDKDDGTIAVWVTDLGDGCANIWQIYRLSNDPIRGLGRLKHCADYVTFRNSLGSGLSITAHFKDVLPLVKLW